MEGICIITCSFVLIIHIYIGNDMGTNDKKVTFVVK